MYTPSNINYLESTIKLFRYYRSLGDKTIAQMEHPTDFYWRANPDSNSLYIIINHLHGNMLSRFTDFLTSDGEKSWRNRDQEFDSSNLSVEEIIHKWDNGWNCLFQAIDPLTPDDLMRTVYIRNEGHTVLEALQRQLAHYACHVGQLIYLGKMIKKESWNSLSISKGESKKYNDKKFSTKKNNSFFTDHLNENL